VLCGFVARSLLPYLPQSPLSDEPVDLVLRICPRPRFFHRSILQHNSHLLPWQQLPMPS